MATKTAPKKTTKSPTKTVPVKTKPKPPAKTGSTPTEKSAFSTGLGGFRKEAAKPKVEPLSAAKNGKAPHLIIKALAGTGKTTTNVNGVRKMHRMPLEIIPSPQQQMIFDALSLEIADSERASSFNKAISEELAKRMPERVNTATIHSFGNSFCRTGIGRYVKMVDGGKWKTINIVERLIGKKFPDMRKEQFPINAIERLVSLCKMNLVDWKDASFPEECRKIAAHHDIDLNGQETTVLNIVPQVLDAAMDYTSPNFEMSFDDMIWLPVICNFKIDKTDLMLIDEAQDLNRCQQEIVMRMAHRLVFCGDPHQAIYGFAGADTESMSRLEDRLRATPRGVQVLPLTVTRRCCKAVVREAQKIVPEFEAHPDNPEGEVTTCKSTELLEILRSIKTQPDADDERKVLPVMVVCRMNAPLVSVCFRLLKEGTKARIQGRDIGQNLVALLKKFRAESVTDLSVKLEQWFETEQEKLLKKKFQDETKLIALQDKYDCLCVFMEDAQSVDGIIAKIESIFSDYGPGILLSSIHRSKGLEATAVYIIAPEKLPHPMAKSAWQVEQEMNLKYVAITRAIMKLVFVQTVESGSGGGKPRIPAATNQDRDQD